MTRRIGFAAYDRITALDLAGPMEAFHSANAHVTGAYELIVLGATTDAYGAERAGFSATTSISRKEFDVSFNAAFGAGNSVVSDKVEISLELEFTKSA